MAIREFEYKGFKVDRETWESAPFPIDCSRITDDDMQELVEELYDILHRHYRYSEESLAAYAVNTNIDDELDALRWQEEEDLILSYGGVYYE